MKSLKKFASNLASKLSKDTPSNGKHVVVVEDNVDLSDALKEILVQNGYSATAVGTGELGIEVVQKEKPNLLILDLNLPGINGVDVLKALKEYRSKNKLSVIVLSNESDPDNVHEARDFGIDEYFIKTDWRMDEIVASVKKHT